MKKRNLIIQEDFRISLRSEKEKKESLSFFISKIRKRRKCFKVPEIKCLPKKKGRRKGGEKRQKYQKYGSAFSNGRPSEKGGDAAKHEIGTLAEILSIENVQLQKR